MTSKTIPLVFFLLISTVATAQESEPWRGPEEIGLRLSSLENFDFIYKREIDQQIYRRVRLIATSFQLIATDDQTVFNVFVGAAIGKEKRVPLTEKLKFHHGWEPGVSIGVSNFQESNLSGRTNLSVNPFLGYVLGFQLTVSNRFTLGIETIPSISAGLNVIERGGSVFNFSAGFNSNAIALTGVYRFIRN